MGNKFRDKVVEEGLEEPRPMPEAEPAEPTVEEPVAAPKARRKSAKAARGLGRVLGGDVLGGRVVIKQIPLVLLCLIYLLLIVGNRYKVESLSQEKVATEERINYLREHRIQMQKQYQQSVKISQIAEDLKGSGVGITSGPPYEL
jgi:hypothetical protein